MKIYIGPHRYYFGPYQIAEKLLFWMDKDTDDRVHDFGSWLCGKDKDSFLLKFCQWIERVRGDRVIKVRIDPYDTWGMDYTLAYIVLPMLKQLKEKQHGAPNVECADVPEELHKANADPQTPEEIENHHADSNHFKRWNWVLDEMIFAFESKNTDWDEQFSSGEGDWFFEPCGTETDANGKPKFYEMKTGPNHTYTVDWDGRNAYQARITNGFRLFGKYFENLWD